MEVGPGSGQWSSVQVLTVELFQERRPVAPLDVRRVLDVAPDLDPDPAAGDRFVPAARPGSLRDPVENTLAVHPGTGNEGVELDRQAAAGPREVQIRVLRSTTSSGAT